MNHCDIVAGNPGNFKDYLGVAFHAYALYRMFSGFKLLSVYDSLKKQEATGAISSTIG